MRLCRREPAGPNARNTVNRVNFPSGEILLGQSSVATDPARITTPERTAEDADAALRPKSLDEFIGQQSAREKLRGFVHAAKARGEALDHVLLHRPAGRRKT